MIADHGFGTAANDKALAELGVRHIELQRSGTGHLRLQPPADDRDHPVNGPRDRRRPETTGPTNQPAIRPAPPTPRTDYFKGK